MGSKTIAVVLAVLAGSFTWLYTYKDDKNKFWIGLAAELIGWILILPPIIVWIWSIVDQASKPSSYFNDLEGSKTIAVVLAIFCGPLTWLYTYEADKKKFWIWVGLVATLSVLTVIAVSVALVEIDLALLGITTLAIGLLGMFSWVYVIIDRAVKPSDYFDRI